MNEKGLTLIEVLASIVILSIIGVSLLTFFVQSSRSNNLSKTMMDATYIAQTHMEEINNLNNDSLTPTSISKMEELLLNEDYTKDTTTEPTCTACYGKDIVGDNRYVFVKLSNHSNSIDNVLGKVLVKIYSDDTVTKQEAQMEMLITWKK